MRIYLFDFMLSLSSLPLEDVIYEDKTRQDKMIWFRIRTPWTKPKEQGSVMWFDMTIANLLLSLGIWDFREIRAIQYKKRLKEV